MEEEGNFPFPTDTAFLSPIESILGPQSKNESKEPQPPTPTSYLNSEFIEVSNGCKT